MERCFIVVFASHVFGFSRNIHSIGFVWCYFLMLNHILFGWGVCLSIYCLHEWLFWSFIVCLIHLSQWFLALLVEITTKIIESLKYCLCHNILLSSFLYSAWFFTSMLVWLSHDQLLPIADLLLFLFSSTSEIWLQVHGWYVPFPTFISLMVYSRTPP